MYILRHFSDFVGIHTYIGPSWKSDVIFLSPLQVELSEGQILSYAKASQLAYEMSVVLLGCALVTEITFVGAHGDFVQHGGFTSTYDNVKCDTKHQNAMTLVNLRYNP